MSYLSQAQFERQVRQYGNSPGTSVQLSVNGVMQLMAVVTMNRYVYVGSQGRRASFRAEDRLSSGHDGQTRTHP